LRVWDKLAARRPDTLVAISETVRSRIRKYYGLDAEIIYPPLMVRASRRSQIAIREPHEQRLAKSEASNYFLVVSRLVPYKRIDIAVRAATKLGVNLKVIGTGNELESLKKIAGPTIEFIGYVTDVELKNYYANCKALIFPGVEDFGLTMVEAQSFGKPVIAYNAGGASEIIINGKTGVFFEKQNSAALAQVLKSFRAYRYNREDCIKNSKRFSFEQFRKKILNLTNI
jgi:glycosyltransferase involved in cell wall biosynthesis